MKMPQNKLLYIILGITGMIAGSYVYDLLSAVFQSIFG